MRRKAWNIRVNMAGNKWVSYGDVAAVLTDCTRESKADGVIGTLRSDAGFIFVKPCMIFLTINWAVGS